jgi:hypothetical protein
VATALLEFSSLPSSLVHKTVGTGTPTATHGTVPFPPMSICVSVKNGIASEHTAYVHIYNLKVKGEVIPVLNYIIKHMP